MHWERLMAPAAIVLLGLVAAPSVSGSEAVRSDRALADLWIPRLTRSGDVRYVPDQLVVRFRAGAARSVRSAALRRMNARVLLEIRRFNIQVIELEPGSDVLAQARALQRQPSVVSAVPNMRSTPTVVPTDPFFPEQWALHNTGQPHAIADPPPASVVGLPDADIDAFEAWSTTMGSSETVVAVIDSGVDLFHPDLLRSLWVNADEVPANGLDDDGNGYVDDTNGWDFKEHDRMPQDRNGHGSHVAGIIAAAMNNGQGTVGVCPECRIMVLKTGDTLAHELLAIDYAVDNGADIVNASYVYDVFLEPEYRAVKKATDLGLLFVAAAGNEAGNNDMALSDVNRNGLADAPLFPASFDLPGVISVAASNDRDEYGYKTGCALAGGRARRCFFTNFGHDSVDIAAPGVDILSTVPGGWESFNGTSMAAPYVAGIAGLIKSLHPEYTVLQLRNAILNSADRPASLERGMSATSGRANAFSALSAATDSVIPASSGNIATAQEIRGVSRGRLAYPMNVNDVFRATLRRGNSYALSLDVPRGKDYDLWIWKPGTSQIWQVGPGCNWKGPCIWLQATSQRARGKDEFISFEPRRSGTYYFHISSWYSTGRYALHMEPRSRAS